MRTYKIEFEKASSLRKQLLWSNLSAIIVAIIAGIMGAAGAGDFALLLFIGVVGCMIWSIVAYWRALWALWEWPGVGVGLLVGFGVFVLNTATGILGSIASIAFMVYVYIQLGKQAGVAAVKREVFEE
jgi:hypothetical protein